MRSCFSTIRSLLLVVYSLVLLVQLLLWPSCEDDNSFSLADDFEDDYILPNMPTNPLDPPMWSVDSSAGQCGNWQKQYTKIHRAIASGDMPPSYFVYTTGNGFPPIIESVPHALKGIGTAFMLALLTDRAFILDWKAPAGFDRLVVPRYINWKPNDIFNNHPTITDHVHNIGSTQWVKNQNGSVDWYINTNFDEYFTHEFETIQSLSYDFTYAILRNKHYRHKIRNLGLHTAKCRLCCIWHYLFKTSTLFNHNLAIYTKNKLRVPPKSDFIFIDLSFQQKNLPQRLIMQYSSDVIKCAERVSRQLKNTVWLIASNTYSILDSIPQSHPKIKRDFGVFYSDDRYLTDLQREQNSTTAQHSFIIPRTEQNALMYYFIGMYLEMESTILITSKHSLYSEMTAAVRHFYYQSGKYLVTKDSGCHLHRYRAT